MGPSYVESLIFLLFPYVFSFFKKVLLPGIFPYFIFQPMYWIPMSVIKFLISKSSLKISNFLFITSCSRFIDEKLFNPQLSSRITVAVSLKCPSVPCAVCFPLSVCFGICCMLKALLRCLRILELTAGKLTGRSARLDGADTQDQLHLTKKEH